MTNDLKLLVDIAWANRHGQVGYRLELGERAAAFRLVRSGLLMVSNGSEYGITRAGEICVGRLSEMVRVRRELTEMVYGKSGIPNVKLRLVKK